MPMEDYECFSDESLRFELMEPRGGYCTECLKYVRYACDHDPRCPDYEEGGE